MVEDEVFLNDIWSFYFHNPISNNWERDGYVKIGDISSIQDFWKLFHAIENHIHNGMFFLMRDYIFPAWDDPNNKDGSFMSFKVVKDKIISFSEQIFIRLLGETFLLPDFQQHWNQINGISLSPKKNFCIVKIWFANKDLKSKHYFNLPKDYFGDVIFKDNIL